MNKPSSVSMCDHCGTVERALIKWLYVDTKECPCKCHEARKYDSMNSKERKKYWQGKQ